MRKIRNPDTEIPLPGFEVFHDEFLKSRREELIGIKSALASEDFKALEDCGHKWKGFCNPYGFQELGEMAVEMEVAAENRSKDQCFLIIKRVEEYLGTED